MCRSEQEKTYSGVGLGVGILVTIGILVGLLFLGRILSWVGL
ncbi:MULTISPECIES: hypothetical protein [unclassified Haladaptatus]|nr:MULTISPECIES: hypothetical protein [unclassified Haladaptatus]